MFASIDLTSDIVNSFDDGTARQSNSSIKAPNFADPLVQGQAANGPQLPVDVCLRHGNKRIKMFCSDHQIVGCTICLMEQIHNNCNKMFIPEIPQKSDEEVDGLLRGLKTLRSRMQLIKDETGQDLLRLTEEKKYILQEIEEYRERIITQVQKIAAKAITNVLNEFKLQGFRMNEIISNADRELGELETYIERLDHITENKSQVFVDFVNASQTRQKTHELERKLKGTAMLKTTKFEINHSVYDAFCESTSFGTLHSEFQTRSKIESSIENIVHDFVSCCVRPDGCIVLADKRNKTLTKLDTHMQNIISTRFNHEPGGICSVGKHQIAVSVPVRMQVAFLNDRLEVENRFGVGLFTYAIHYYRGYIYVVCRATAEPGLSPDEIRVFNKVGIFQTLIKRSLFEPYPRPRDDGSSPVNGHFNTINCLTSDGKHLYVACSYGALIQLDSDHRVVTINCDDERLEGVSGLSWHRSSLYICNRDKNTVFVLDERVNELQTLFTDVQGVIRPTDVCFNALTAQVVVLLKDCNDVLLFGSVREEL